MRNWPADRLDSPACHRGNYVWHLPVGGAMVVVQPGRIWLQKYNNWTRMVDRETLGRYSRAAGFPLPIGFGVDLRNGVRPGEMKLDLGIWLGG